MIKAVLAWYKGRHCDTAVFSSARNRKAIKVGGMSPRRNMRRTTLAPAETERTNCPVEKGGS